MTDRLTEIERAGEAESELHRLQHPDATEDYLIGRRDGYIAALTDVDELPRQKQVAEEYLNGLCDYLDMVLDAEPFENNRIIYQDHLNSLTQASRIISLYNTNKEVTT